MFDRRRVESDWSLASERKERITPDLVSCLEEKEWQETGSLGWVKKSSTRMVLLFERSSIAIKRVF